MIEGVVVEKRSVIADERGKVLHMLRADSPLFSRFGEVYFSVVNPGVVKAWKRHLRMSQHFVVPVGKIRLVIHDDRPGSSSSGRTEILEIGEDSYCLVKIPPRLWYGFKGISLEPALIANCTDLVHDPAESERRDSLDAIPSPWD